MSDDWFSFQLAPDGDVEDGCHPKEADALKKYLRQKTTANEAAQAITRPIVAAENPKYDLSNLYGLLMNALVELPSEHIEPLLALLQAIENLPEPDFSALEKSKRPNEQLWKGLSNFGNQWYDRYYRSGSWKMDAENTSGLERDKLRNERMRTSEIEARIVILGLADIKIDWGYEVVVEALESDEALLDFEVPAAAEWFVVCGKRFREGAEMGEKSYALKDEVMSLKKWSLWKDRLRELQARSGVIERAATKALEAMQKVDGEHS